MKKFNDIAYRVSFISIILNILLSIIKFIAGIIGNSQAMISDSIHSLTDVISTFVVIIGIYASKKKADNKHQYGHERYECLSAIILSFILIITGFYIGYSGIKCLIEKSYTKVDVTSVALFAAIISILIKEWMYRYTYKAAKKINSSSLKADAWHHRSDALSSIGALIGIVGSMLGYKFLDSLSSIVICIFIIKSALDIMKESFDKVMDVSLDIDKINKIKEDVMSIDGVKRIGDIKTRMFGNKAYIDLEIAVDGNMILKDAHTIAEKVHDKVENDFKECKHCMVHVNPYE